MFFVTVSFILNIVQFQIQTHIPALVAFIILICPAFTTVSPNALVGASVVCFLNAFFALYFLYIMMQYNPCASSEELPGGDGGGGGGDGSDQFRYLLEQQDDITMMATTNSTSGSGDDEDPSSTIADYCAERPEQMLYNFVSTLLWTITGLLACRIPQPGNYSTGQTTTFDSAPDSAHDLDLELS